MQAAGTQKLLASKEIGRWAGHMFDHLHIQNHVKLFLRLCQGFGSDVAIINA